MRNTLEYRAWARMKQACYNPNSNVYPSHGAKGVRITSEWINDFGLFYEQMGPMPTNCNGLERHDKTKDFCRFNCYWALKTRGNKRKAKEGVRPKKVTKACKIKQPVSICLTIEKEHLDFIKRQALHKSVEQGHIVEANDLIRDAIKERLPMPKQLTF